MTLPEIGDIWRYVIEDMYEEYHVILSEGKEFNFKAGAVGTSYETFDLLNETFEVIYIGNSTYHHWVRLT